jgi:hypothetical protein
MRFVVFVKASKESEAGAMPKESELAEMGNFNDELVKAGMMLAGEGLHPSKNAKRIEYSGKSQKVIDGPFAETKELVAGFWILQAKSWDEVMTWMKRAPFRDGQVEVRQVFESEDFGEALTPELRAQEDRQRKAIESQQKKK